MKIIYAGRSTAPIKTFPYHFHRSWEIIYSFDGTGDALIDGKIFSFRPGTIFLMPPGIPHQKVAEKGYTDGSLMITELNIPGRHFVLCNDDGAGTGRRIFELIHEMFYRNEEDPEVAKALVNALCAFIFNRGKQSGYKNPAVERMETLLVDNITNGEFDLTEELEHTGYGRNYFRKLFRDGTGETPLNYLHRLRIDFAKQEISRRQGNCRIGEIAAMAGFSDPYYFSRVFKQVEGISPREYQKRSCMKETQENAIILEAQDKAGPEMENEKFRNHQEFDEWV